MHLSNGMRPWLKFLALHFELMLLWPWGHLSPGDLKTALLYAKQEGAWQSLAHATNPWDPRIVTCLCSHWCYLFSLL